MSFKSFIVACRGAPFAPRFISPLKHASAASSVHVGWRERALGYAAEVHALMAAPSAAQRAVRCADVTHVSRARAFAIRHAARAAVLGARAMLRAAFAGRPLTPGGYAILALAMTGVVLAVLVVTSPAGDELESALPLCGLFA